MMMNCLIYNATHDPARDWCAIGATKEEADERCKNGIATGKFERPAYRVVAIRKIKLA